MPDLIFICVSERSLCHMKVVQLAGVSPLLICMCVVCVCVCVVCVCVVCVCACVYLKVLA